MATAINTQNTHEPWFTTNHKAAHIVDEMLKIGIAPQQLLQNTGLCKNDIFDEDGHISFSQSITLIKNAVKLSEVDGLGLQIGACENTSSYGLMGYAMSCTPNMKEAAEIAIKYQKASPSLMNMSLVHTGSESSLIATSPRSLGEEISFLVEEVFSAIKRSFYFLSGKNVAPQSVHFSYAEPSYSQLYKNTFNCPIFFNAPHNKIIYKKEDLEIPTLQGNLVAQKVANSLCDKYLKSHAAEDDIAQQVRSALFTSPGKFPNEDMVALQLGIHSRNLRRQLKSNNTSFQRIFDGVREQLACEYLQNSKLALDDIAELVGFSDASNFRRAFKRWTGKVPSAYRVKKQDTVHAIDKALI